MKKAYWFLSLLCTLFFEACSGDVVYSRLVPITSHYWSIDSTAIFDYTLDSVSDYEMTVFLRHTERYPYQNIWLFIQDSTCGDTIMRFLADDRGQWLGDRHHGFIEIPIRLETRSFVKPGEHHLEIQHGMRDSLLRGVTDIGLEIRYYGEE